MLVTNLRGLCDLLVGENSWFKNRWNNWKTHLPNFCDKGKKVFPKPSQVHTKFYILFDIATSELHVLEVKISQAQDTNDQR